VTLARFLILLSSALFAVTGFAYLIVPGAALTVVGIDSTAASEFLLRTEGVVLLTAAALLWAIRATRAAARVGLLALAGYYLVGSLVDLLAFYQGTVQWPSVPSAALRIGLGLACAVTAARLGPSA
jgi:hypothetical protein